MADAVQLSAHTVAVRFGFLWYFGLDFCGIWLLLFASCIIQPCAAGPALYQRCSGQALYIRFGALHQGKYLLDMKQKMLVEYIINETNLGKNGNTVRKYL